MIGRHKKVYEQSTTTGRHLSKEQAAEASSTRSESRSKSKGESRTYSSDSEQWAQPTHEDNLENASSDRRE